MPRQKADFAWYSEKSRKLGLPPRCPLAHAELCPRYNQSIDLLGKERALTKIPSERASALDRKWKLFKPVVAEEEPCIFATGEERQRIGGISHFCPEVSYDTYGYFACGLHEYVDEIDRESAYQLAKSQKITRATIGRTEIDRESAYQLAKEKGVADEFDSRWCWITPRHYTECREYSIHGTFAKGKSSAQRKGLPDQLRWQVIARDAFTCCYCGRKPPEVTLQVDHRVSVRDGGTDDLDNLVTACRECNGGKADSSL